MENLIKKLQEFKEKYKDDSDLIKEIDTAIRRLEALRRLNDGKAK